MPTTCCITSCRNDRGNTRHLGISFHRLPKNPEIRAKWVAFCGENSVSSSRRVCSAHFKRTDFVRDLRNELIGNPPRKILREDAVPCSLFNDEVKDPEKNSQCVETVLKKIEENRDRKSSEFVMNNKSREESESGLQFVSTNVSSYKNDHCDIDIDIKKNCNKNELHDEIKLEPENLAQEECQELRIKQEYDDVKLEELSYTADKCHENEEIGEIKLKCENLVEIERYGLVMKYEEVDIKMEAEDTAV